MRPSRRFQAMLCLCYAMLPGGFRFARKVLAQLSYNYPGLLHRCAHAWVAPPSTGLSRCCLRICCIRCGACGRCVMVTVRYELVYAMLCYAAAGA